MTEAEWLAAINPEMMFAFLGNRVSDRKRRLFACACCRRHWDWVADTPAATAVEVSEAFADGLTTEKKLRAAQQEAQETAARFYAEYRQTQGVEPHIAHMHASACADAATPTGGRSDVRAWAPRAANFAAQTYACEANNSLRVGSDAWKAHFADETAAHAAVLRDIIGNPFHPVAFSREWRTSDVMLLANGVYDDRAFDRLPILADALQDAGCDSDDLLSHLRAPDATHVRGCWALDLVLGKE